MTSRPLHLHFMAPRAWLALGTLVATLASPVLQAQTVYRVVGPDGKVTFSDRPPPSASSPQASPPPTAGGVAGGAASASLPYELRQVAQKYPVVLYTTANCVPCGAGRSFLASRGVPFNEKTVTTAADNEALQRISGDASLPLLAIGSQQLKGFSDAEWTQFLNAAGYPKSSRLPASYRPPAPAPLVTLTTAPTAKPASPGPEASPPSLNGSAATAPVTPPVTSDNPAGIRF